MQTETNQKNNIVHLAYFNLGVVKLMLGLDKLNLSNKAMEKLIQHDWSQNINELESVIEQAARVCKNGMIEPEDLNMNSSVDQTSTFPVGLRLEDLERKYILQTLYFVQQNRTKAAELLGISIRTLRNKINQYRLEGFL